jgi:hypothetical protein
LSEAFEVVKYETNTKGNNTSAISDVYKGKSNSASGFFGDLKVMMLIIVKE